MTDFESIILQRLERIERVLRDLQKERKDKKPQTWVTVFGIYEVTGWDAKYLRKMRESGLVKTRRKDGKFEYLVESIPQQLIKLHPNG